mmetsp:Transcript_40452/g.128888  ORF Transcript_40452/g.128888 Transcript_40452/m.128888 type:complete len:324 (+) Transcript_40452:139-1110(+)
MIPASLPLTIISYLESIAIAKVLASKKGYDISPSQELFALGLADVGGAFFGSFAASGGFGRTAVNNVAGAKTTLASLISVLVVVLTLLFLMPLFYNLPNTVLAAIVMQSTYSLIDFSETKAMWAVCRRDWLAHMVAVIATCFLGVTWGLLLAVLVSLGSLVQRLSRPYTAVLGRLKESNNTEVYRNVIRYSEARRVHGVEILRFDAEICFANADFFHDRVRKLVAAGESREGEGSVTHVVLDACGINDIDLAGIHTLEDVHNGLKKRGVALLVASTKGPVRSALITSGTYEKMGAESFYLSIGDAVAAAVVQRVAAGDDGEEV